MKPTCRTALLSLLVLAFVLPLSAQDNAPSLGDLARQERERKQQQSAKTAQNETDAAELTGLKEANFKANILITESKDAVEKWVLMPAAERPGAGRIRQVMPDKKYYLPFVVTEYPFPPSEPMDLTVHVRMVNPKGELAFSAAKFSETVGPDPRSPSVIVLNPVMDITFEHSDPVGTYTFRITITDHIHSTYSMAEEQFQLVHEPATEGKAGN